MLGLQPSLGWRNEGIISDMYQFVKKFNNNLTCLDRKVLLGVEPSLDR
ncbi:MAG TPA: hypothetical protein V6C91_17510 [Coleofasciculaceae cyanobacterium]